MNNHVRVDTIKVFKEDTKRLNQIMVDLNTKEKSAAWREALVQYEKNREASQKIEQLTEQVKMLVEKVDSLYFIIQTIIKE